MAKSELVVALDIGTTKVCTLVAEVTGEEQIEILGIGLTPSLGMKKGVVVDIPATAAAIRESVDKASRMAGVHIATVYVGITGEHIASLNSRGRVGVPQEIGDDHVQQARLSARHLDLPPDREVLHNIPRQYIVDGQEGVRHPVGMSATKLEVETHVVTAASSFVENVVKCVTRARLEIDEIVVEPLATGLAVLTDAERQLGVALADIGGGTTDVALFENGAVTHTKIIPVGGNHLTNDLAIAFRLDPEQAEKLKVASGAALPEDVAPDQYVEIRMIGEEESREIPRALLPEIIQPRMEELFELLREHIEAAAKDGIYVSTCVLSGGGSQLLGAAELAQRVLGMPVRLGRPREIIDPRGLAGSPICATAVGLLAYASQRRVGRRRVKEPKALHVAAFARLARLFRRGPARK
ncbi:MAG: cell division protein FtsA [Armatimonadota bacterium]